jgi:hypothetical protein
MNSLAVISGKARPGAPAFRTDGGKSNAAKAFSIKVSQL